MMKKLFALSVILIAFTVVAFSQSSASASAAATIYAPITIATDADMDFGTLASSATGGTCILPPVGDRTTTGGITLMGGTPLAARFTITGRAGQFYSLVLPSSATVSDGTNTMTINDWQSDRGSGEIPTDGSVVLHVGATLNIAPNQPPGIYSTNNSGGTGNFTVTVNYQ